MIVKPLFVPAAASSYLIQPAPLCNPVQQPHQEGDNIIMKRLPLHAGSGTRKTALNAFHNDKNGASSSASSPSVSKATQLQYRTVVDSYLEDISGSTETSLHPGLTRLLDSTDWSMLQKFRVIRETAQICYQHFVNTQSLWGNEDEKQRRAKFVPLLSPVQQESFEAMFHLVDKDHDGQISMPDLNLVMNTVSLGDESLFDNILENKNEGVVLTLEEFIGIAAEAEFYNLLLETFGGMDTNNSGYIRVDQVSCMLKELTTSLYNPKFDEQFLKENSCTAMIDDMIAQSQSEEGKDICFNYEDFTRCLLGMN